MTIFTNIQRLKFGRFLSTTASIAGLLMLVTATITTFTPRLGASAYPLLLVGILFSMLGLRASARWTRPPLAHVSLASALKGFPRDITLFNYWPVARHLLLTPTGVFCLTVKSTATTQRIDGKHWDTSDPLLLRLRRLLAQDSLGDPVADAQTDAARAQRWLQRHLPDIPISVTSILVFTHPDARLDVVNQPSIPVTYADKRKPSLKSFLRNDHPPIFSTEQLHRIATAIQTPR